MQARYLDPETGRFLSMDAVGVSPGQTGSVNGYAYVSNNPISRIDPSGNYERGSGWTDKDWDRFDKAQQRVASEQKAAATKLFEAAEETAAGGDLSASTRNTVAAFENVVGAGSASPAALAAAAIAMSDGAKALSAGAGSGFVANAKSALEWGAMGLSKNGLAAAEVGGSNIYVNTSHSSFHSSSTLRWAAGHESLHTAGLHDQRIEGHTAYKFDDGGYYFRLLRDREPNRAAVNPDHLTDFVQ
ncbi:RHS repeat-associated core domain-containing protein [Luteibacter rhizovicinus]|nr:RHS repeat-associated core domain-containing protein [Luteibacter rhizovicinus]